MRREREERGGKCATPDYKTAILTYRDSASYVAQILAAA